MVLAAAPVKRIFTYVKNGKEINLEDLPNAPTPDDVIKFYSGTYPELTTASVEPPVFKGANIHFKVKSEAGTKG